jgi:hypothetical protein
MTAVAIREGLRCGARGCSCRKGGIVHCPAHDDRSPSLSVNEKARQVLVHCFSGCTQDSVIAALRERRLWANSESVLNSAYVWNIKRIPSSHACCPDCRALMWWPTRDHPGAYWCEDCSKFVLKQNVIEEMYEFPPVPAGLRRK